MYCCTCGKAIDDTCRYCPECGSQQVTGQFTNYYYQLNKETDQLAVWGFGCALAGFCLPLPLIDCIIGIMGTIFCIKGLKSARHGKLAAAGVVIGILGVIGSIMLVLLEPDVYLEW